MNKIYQLYLELYEQHGEPEILWPQWCAKVKNKKLREIIAIGAFMTQRTSWHNADLALRNLKKAELLSLKKIANLKSCDELTGLIRPAGFFQTKPKRVFEFARFITQEYGNLKNLMREDLKTTREKLLNLYGIGPETADVILTYVLDNPSFVIDEYTRRLVLKKGLSEILEYNHLKRLFESNLPKDLTIYQNFHALIIIEQRGKKAAKMEIV